MSSECEVTRMFIRYMQQYLRNERMNQYRRSKRHVKHPLEDWLLEEIAQPGHLEEFILIEKDVAQLE